MSTARWICATAVASLLIGCTDPSEGSLCERTLEPYADLVSGQARTPKNGAFLDGMAAYSNGDYTKAAELLRSYLSDREAAKSAHLYLACAYLELGKPYDAELQIDKLENSNLKDFKDQCEWYTVVCWVCSDQLPRALEGAKAIASAAHHTYKAEAADLLQALGTTAVK